MSDTAAFWLSTRQLAELLGVHIRTISDLKHSIPAEGMKGKAKALRFDARVAVRIWIDRKLEQARGDAATKPLPTGPDWLEEKRREEALTARSEREQREGKLVKTDAVLDMIRPLASIFRSGVDRARREFGNPVGDFMNEVVDEFDAAAGKVIENLDDRDDRKTDARI